MSPEVTPESKCLRTYLTFEGLNFGMSSEMGDNIRRFLEYFSTICILALVVVVFSVGLFVQNFDHGIPFIWNSVHSIFLIDSSTF